jgi:hypothetical protein
MELTWEEIAARLSREEFWWLTTQSASDGPHAVPVWGVVVAGAAYTYASPTSRRSRNVAADDRVLVHAESASDVLIVRGRLSDHGPVAADRDVNAAYRAKYTHPDHAQWLPDAPEMVGDDRMMRLHPTAAMAWNLDDLFGSQRRWTA